jgi:hypothetical protein
VSAVCFQLSAVYNLLSCCLLPANCCTLSVCLLSNVYCLQSGVCCPLSAVCWSLANINMIFLNSPSAQRWISCWWSAIPPDDEVAFGSGVAEPRGEQFDTPSNRPRFRCYVSLERCDVCNFSQIHSAQSRLLRGAQSPFFFSF